jgi:hypothetical protein
MTQTPTDKTPPANSTRGQLLKMIEAVIAANPTLFPTPESFGWAAIKDSYLVTRLRTGGDITTGKLDAIAQYLKPFQQKKD